MARRRPSKPKVVPRVKLWLERDEQYVFGWGLSCILEAVEQTGSIKEAAARLGKSYRHIWSRVKQAEASLGIPLVETRVGGEGRQRSHLTEPARLLLREYVALRRDVKSLVETQFATRLSPLLESVLKAQGPPD